jgi:hypothetical protein
LNIPEDFKRLDDAIAGQVKLAGAKVQVAAEAIQVGLAWQAWPKAQNDFTIFVQLLGENQQRLAGVDVLPEQSFTSLDRKEVMVTQHSLALPADLKPGQYTILVGLYYFAGDQLINVGAIPLDTVTKF